MKKQKLSILVVLTIAFASFILGFLLGRNGRQEPVALSIPAAMMTAPPPEATVTTPTVPAVSFPIDINRADWEELTALPGIGEVLAKRIIAHREVYGRFSSVEELMLVEDIGEKRLEAILELITVGG